MKSTFQKILTGAAVFAVATTVASADTICFEHVTPDGTAPFSDTFTLPNFDSSLGTLTNVEVTFTYSVTGLVRVFNLGDSSEDFTNATATVPVTLSGPFGLSNTTDAVAGPLDGTAAPGLNEFPGVTGTGTVGLPIAPIDFPLFATPPNAGTYSYTVSAGEGSYAGTGSTALLFGGNATAGGTTTICFTYEPNTVPDGGSALLLMGLGLASVGFVRRKLSV